MKCYQIAGRDIIPGLPVNHDGKRRPWVTIGKVEVPLSNELIETNPGQRVLDCDIKVTNEGVVELVPSSGPADTVLVAYALTNSRTHLKSKIAGPTTGIIAVSSELTSYVAYVGSYYGEAVLARMAPGCVISLVLTNWKRKPSKGFFPIFSSPEFEQVPSEVAFLKMTDEGKLVFTQPEAQ